MAGTRIFSILERPERVNPVKGTVSPENVEPSRWVALPSGGNVETCCQGPAGIKDENFAEPAVRQVLIFLRTARRYRGVFRGFVWSFAKVPAVP